MARDWIKMRTDLYRDPKVILMADLLMDPEGELARYVNQHNGCNMSVTRNVTRNAVVGALVTVWGTVRHQGKRSGDDLVLTNCPIHILDDIAEMDGFGDAMSAAGWVNDEDNTLTFPAFFAENNVDPNEEKAAKNAERQRRYREQQKAKRDVTSDVTRNVTDNVTRNAKRNAREEKSREENESIYAAPPKTEAPKLPAIAKTFDDVIIPKALRSEKCQEAVVKWHEYLSQIGCDYKRPDASAISLQEWYMQMARMGADKFVEAVSLSIAGKHQTVKQGLVDNPFDKPSKSKDPSGDWLTALAVCREFPSGSQHDTEARRAKLTEAQLQACRAVGFTRIHGADSFTTKQIEAEFMHALKGVTK